MPTTEPTTEPMELTVPVELEDHEKHSGVCVVLLDSWAIVKLESDETIDDDDEDEDAEEEKKEEVPEEPPQPTGWNCGICTFLNEPSQDSCGMCLSPKPAEE